MKITITKTVDQAEAERQFVIECIEQGCPHCASKETGKWWALDNSYLALKCYKCSTEWRVENGKEV